MSKIIIMLLVMLTIIGCATTVRYEASLAQWVGKPEDDLLSALGAPNSSYNGSNGARYLTYITNKKKSIFTSASYVFTNSSVYEEKCSTTFTIIDGKVVSWSYVGASCRL
ncbi:conserved hypothetical protein [Candidatus Xenohaliotis californiensis]|uniref:Outer membrane lipoprotein n=1 Tax=Candidatus Xenohaliotis californiensis TaxID=84677 RepID=A0ABM9N780_9RICK|nr:conserved hypothetical protein [Candidatus Xenohaliotis californiensis]